MAKRLNPSKPNRPRLSNYYTTPFQLVDVRLFELKAERCEKPAETEGGEVIPLQILLQSEDKPDDGPLHVFLIFEMRFSVEQEVVDCHISMTIEGVFDPIIDVEAIKPEAIKRFKESEALIALWPYLRQMLHDVTVKMRLDIPPLPAVDINALAKEIRDNNEDEEEDVSVEEV